MADIFRTLEPNLFLFVIIDQPQVKFELFKANAKCSGGASTKQATTLQGCAEACAKSNAPLVPMIAGGRANGQKYHLFAFNTKECKCQRRACRYWEYRNRDGFNLYKYEKA